MNKINQEEIFVIRKNNNAKFTVHNINEASQLSAISLVGSSFATIYSSTFDYSDFLTFMNYRL